MLNIFPQSPDHDVAEEMLSSVYNQRRMPQFLSNAAPDAEVHSGFLDILDSFQQDQGGREPLADTVKELTGEPLLSAVSASPVQTWTPSPSLCERLHMMTAWPFSG